MKFIVGREKSPPAVCVRVAQCEVQNQGLRDCADARSHIAFGAGTSFQVVPTIS